MKRTFIILLSFICLSATAQQKFSIVDTFAKQTIFSDTTKHGKIAIYNANYGSSFTTRTMVDKGYVDSIVATVSSSTPTLQQVMDASSFLNRDNHIWTPSGTKYKISSGDTTSGTPLSTLEINSTSGSYKVAATVADLTNGSSFSLLPASYGLNTAAVNIQSGFRPDAFTNDIINQYAYNDAGTLNISHRVVNPSGFTARTGVNMTLGNDAATSGRSYYNVAVDSVNNTISRFNITKDSIFFQNHLFVGTLPLLNTGHYYFPISVNGNVADAGGNITVSTGSGGVADPGANGVMVRTASNVTTARTLTGTTSRISITNGDGVSGAPTFDIGSDVATLSGSQTFSGSKTFSQNLLVNNSVVITGEYLTDTYLRTKAIATPVTPSTGYAIYYAGTDGHAHYINAAGTDFDLTTTGSGGMTNPMTTTGDMIYSSDNSGTPARLAAGTNGYMLSLIGGIPAWVNGATWSGLVGGGSISGSTGSFSVTAGTQYYVNTSAGASTYNLPALSANRFFYFKNAGSGVMTIARNGTDVIWTTASVTSFDLNPGESVQIVGGASSWYAFFNAFNASSTSTLTNKTIDFGSNTVTSTSAQLRTALSDENGTGAALFNGATNPDFTTGFTIGTAAASGKIIQGDGTKFAASAFTLPTSVGSSGKVLVSNGTNYVESTPTFPNASATSGKVIKSDGTNWVASTETFAAPGTSGNIPTSDGTNWTSTTNEGGWTKVKVAGSDVTNSTTTMADVTGLITGTLSNATTYWIDIRLIVNSSSTAGATFQVVLGGSGSGSIVALTYTGSNVTTVGSLAASASPTASLVTINGDGFVEIKGYVKTLSAGTATIKVQQAKTTSGSVISRIGSYIATKPL